MVDGKNTCWVKEHMEVTLSSLSMGAQDFRTTRQLGLALFITFHPRAGLLPACGHIFGFSGEFCLPQFDPEFLVTPKSLAGDWSKVLLG